MTAIAVVRTASEDLLRVIQEIAPGIGCIGAAAVLQGDHVITGINTAASIRISAAVGSSITFMLNRPGFAGGSKH